MLCNNNYNCDDVDYQGQLNLAKLKKLRDKCNWEMKKERRKFFRKFDSMIKNWKGHLPNLRDIFRTEEIDWILAESVKSALKEIELNKVIDFVIDAGYKDQPEVDNDGKPLLRRTTAVHHAINGKYHDIVPKLFEIYDKYNVNYIDKSGYTHFHAACERGCHNVVEKFLELGQDPNCLAQKSVEPPIHLALWFHHDEIVELLMKNGADPNLANEEGSTPLHVISSSGYDDDIIDDFFKINDEKDQTVLVDARDNEGKTPLRLAVSNLVPHVVDVLLDRGADLSSFVFPNESDYADNSGPNAWSAQNWDDFTLRLASGALGVVENLEKRGYEMDRSDSLTIMKLFAKYELFEKSADNVKPWFEKAELVEKADNVFIYFKTEHYHNNSDKKDMSLYDLLQLRTEEAEKLLTFKDYFKFARQGDYWCFPMSAFIFGERERERERERESNFSLRNCKKSWLLVHRRNRRRTTRRRWGRERHERRAAKFHYRDNYSRTKLLS
uniref:Uncharacterized protein n=1 Tax=Trichogramma kaykai TaxID=54128 RepID=A0ABD2XLJ0_9HYME